MQFESFKFMLLVCCLAFMVYQVDSVRLCGSRLAEFLGEICRNGYNTKVKRTLPGDYNSIDVIGDSDNSLGNYGAYSDLEFESQPLLRALLGESAHHLLTTRRRRLGISDECCLKPCSQQELMQYCTPDSSL